MVYMSHMGGLDSTISTIEFDILVASTSFKLLVVFPVIAHMVYIFVKAVSYEPTCCTKVIFRHESEVYFPLSDVAVTASLDGVWIVVGEGFLLGSGVEAEESFGVALEGFAGA